MTRELPPPEGGFRPRPQAKPGRSAGHFVLMYRTEDQETPVLMVSELIALARGERDEVSLRARTPERFELSRAPVVVWNVCRHCNMTCPHCYAAASVEPSPTDLDTATALRIVKDLASASVRVVIFSGGEPLLRGDLLELIAAARDLGISPQLSTNGVLIDRDMARRLADAGVAYVGVSIDGPAAWNDAYRGLEGGFARALAGLGFAKECGMRTGLRVTVTARNAHAVGELLALCRTRRIDRFYLSHLVYAGRGRKLMGDDLGVAQTRELLLQLFCDAEQLLAAGEPLHIVTGGNDSAGPLLLQFIEAQHGAVARAKVQAVLLARGGNSAGERMVDIDARGRVHPDQFWTQATLGDLTTQSFRDVLAHPLRAELRERTARLEGRCGQCTFVGMCRGSHRERALAATGRMWAPDPACVMSDEEILGASSQRGVA